LIYLQIEPQNVEPFKEFLIVKGWDIASQEGGQSNFIGWAYIIHMTKELDGKLAEAWLHYSENMSEKESHIELNITAKNELTIQLKEFNEQV
jgi:hypothetical protein